MYDGTGLGVMWDKMFPSIVRYHSVISTGLFGVFSGITCSLLTYFEANLCVRDGIPPKSHFLA